MQQILGLWAGFTPRFLLLRSVWSITLGRGIPGRRLLPGEMLLGYLPGSLSEEKKYIKITNSKTDYFTHKKTITESSLQEANSQNESDYIKPFIALA